MNLQEILKLPAEEKMDMVDQILESLNTNDIKIPNSQKTELDRRLDLDNKGKTTWFSLEEAKTRLNKPV